MVKCHFTRLLHTNMTCFYYNILVIFFIAISFTNAGRTKNFICNVNEIQDNCPSECQPDECPRSEDYQKYCKRPNICPQPVCKCGFNYKRAENGTCIDIRSCPPFPCTRPNEVYNPCPPLCPGDSCDQANLEDECLIYGGLFIVLQCTPSCRCKPGYWRDNGVCVPFSKCPGRNSLDFTVDNNNYETKLFGQESV